MLQNLVMGSEPPVWSQCW